MVFNAIDSPDIVPSSSQPKYVVLEYCFISILLYVILSFPAYFNPWGTPQEISDKSEKWLLMSTLNAQSN